MLPEKILAEWICNGDRVRLYCRHKEVSCKKQFSLTSPGLLIIIIIIIIIIMFSRFPNTQFQICDCLLPTADCWLLIPGFLQDTLLQYSDPLSHSHVSYLQFTIYPSLFTVIFHPPLQHVELLFFPQFIFNLVLLSRGPNFVCLRLIPP